MAKIPTYGEITLDGQSYLEVPQIFAHQVTVTKRGQTFDPMRLTLPGVSDFLLKGLSREVLMPGDVAFPGQFPVGSHVSVDRHFLFRLNNAEGSTQFFSGGLGVFDDLAIDNLCFGSGQFPYLLVPPVPVHATGSLMFEVADATFGSNQNMYPYTIYLAFHGSYLIPSNQPAQAQGGVSGYL